MQSKSLPLLVRCCQYIGLPPDKILFLISDLFCLMGSAVVAIVLRLLIGNYVIWPYAFSTMFGIFALSPLIALALGLYTSSMLEPPYKVLYKLFCYVSITYSIIFIIFFFSKTGMFHSRFTLLAGWALACLAVPLGRHLIVRRFSRYSWWGYPLIFFNRSRTGKDVWHYLRQHPEKGFRPVGFFDFPNEPGEDTRSELKNLLLRFPGAVAMIAEEPGGKSGRSFLSFVNTYFSRILIMPVAEHNEAVRQFLLTPYVLDTTTGFFLQQRLHDKRRTAIKRCLDLVLCLLGSVIILPLVLVLAIAIRLDSKGPVFYAQKRIGRGGREIKVHKFRTMVENADEILAEYLKDPELAAEWDRDHKLKNDPRITRVGHFLRRTSLDELPQLYDVIRGTMSLVGPRPIVEDERQKYGSVFNDYIRVRPGITGMWQISGRNDTSYTKRVEYDFFYVSNWSVWLDIWILMRTVPVVLFGKGAY